MIVERGDDRFDITNFGAILFARNPTEFDRLSRKALRVIQYKDKSRVETVREQVRNNGYAVGFEGAIGFINNLLPQNEQIEQALRRTVPVYPEIAIRELVANALIHQDFSMTGTGPMVEIFTDRVEVTNPGTPLIDTLRFIDEPPQSRNEDLAALMRRMNICEERGSGVDKVIFHVELFQLPAPEFVVTDSHTKAILFAPRAMNEMDQKDRIRACYQHACLRYVSNEQMTNSSFRDRLGIDQKNYATVSRITRETVDAGLVRAVDPTTSKRYMKYVPFWALSAGSGVSFSCAGHVMEGSRIGGFQQNTFCKTCVIKDLRLFCFLWLMCWPCDGKGVDRIVNTDIAVENPQ